MSEDDDRELSLEDAEDAVQAFLRAAEAVMRTWRERVPWQRLEDLAAKSHRIVMLLERSGQDYLYRFNFHVTEYAVETVQFLAPMVPHADVEEYKGRWERVVQDFNMITLPVPEPYAPTGSGMAVFERKITGSAE